MCLIENQRRTWKWTESDKQLSHISKVQEVRKVVDFHVIIHVINVVLSHFSNKFDVIWTIGWGGSALWNVTHTETTKMI